MAQDLFGTEIIENELLRDKFIEPPFSVLDTKTGNWQNRKRLWKRLGIRSEVGRDCKLFSMGTNSWETKEEYQDPESTKLNTSIFDPALCEVIYRWFVPDGGNILDPFAGGSVRGIVAAYLYYKYSGIDIRQEQIDSNYEQARQIVPNNIPDWVCADSDIYLDKVIAANNYYDLIFSCPPYADLEVYSDLPGDISNMNYAEFIVAYRSIIKKSCQLLKPGGYAIFVVGEVRDKYGNYIGFVPDTIDAFIAAGVKYYNEAILLNAIASASMRANGNMVNKKLVKIHQNVLIFKK